MLVTEYYHVDQNDQCSTAAAAAAIQIFSFFALTKRTPTKN